MRQVHDGLHVVPHRLDEAGAALRVFVLGFCPLRLPGPGIAEPIAAARGVADVILVIEPDVEPNRGVKRPVLIQAEPGQFVIEHFTAGFGEVSVLNTPIRNRAADAVDELAHGSLPLRHALLAVKVLRDDHLGGELRPIFRHLHIVLFENDFPCIVGDFGDPPLPFDLVKWMGSRIAECPLDTQCLLRRRSFASRSMRRGDRRRATASLRGSISHNLRASLHHGCPFTAVLPFGLADRLSTKHPA